MTLPPFITCLNIEEGRKKESQSTEMTDEDGEFGSEHSPEAISKGKKHEMKSDGCNSEDERKVDSLFYRICYLSTMVGVNFYRCRNWYQRAISSAIVAVNVCINSYFILHILYHVTQQSADTATMATSLGLMTSSLQATLSTLFLAYWQSTQQPCTVLQKLYEAHQGVGIQKYRGQLRCVVRSFYIIISFIFVYITASIVCNLLDYDIMNIDPAMSTLFDNKMFFIIFRIANMYTIVCWAVALFIFSLLIQATNYEFVYFNEQVRGIRNHESCSSDECLCDYLIELIQVHNRLTDCVKRLDFMFNKYAFIMIATIIPTTIFTMFIVARRLHAFSCLLFTFPIVLFCVFSFYSLTKGPSQLHNTIYNTKSALCSNINIWFPYRPSVYHAALAFACHLDQANLGISIWGFAVVSKSLVLTTLSVMATCLALFLQVGECKFNA